MRSARTLDVLRGKRSTERVPTEVGVCNSVVLGILGSIIFSMIYGNRLGNG